MVMNEFMPEFEPGKAHVHVSTTTLLPSGAVVTVQITRLPEGSYTVSDDSCSVLEIAMHGHSALDTEHNQKGKEIADRFGLVLDERGFRSEKVTADQLPAAIIYVAEAARQWTTSVIMESSRADLFLDRAAEPVSPASNRDRGRD